MAPSQGGQPEEVNFTKSSENRLPALKAIHKTTDKNRFSVIECTIQPQSFPDSLCAHECVFVVEDQKPHVFLRPCLVTAFQISIFGNDKTSSRRSAALRLGRSTKNNGCAGSKVVNTHCGSGCR